MTDEQLEPMRAKVEAEIKERRDRSDNMHKVDFTEWSNYDFARNDSDEDQITILEWFLRDVLKP